VRWWAVEAGRRCLRDAGVHTGQLQGNPPRASQDVLHTLRHDYAGSGARSRPIDRGLAGPGVWGLERCPGEANFGRDDAPGFSFHSQFTVNSAQTAFPALSERSMICEVEAASLLARVEMYIGSAPQVNGIREK
jgi:hypothetical protein